MRVLIADDSGTMRTIIRRSLESLGVAGAVEAADGIQALQIFRSGGFELVFTDWNMPGKSGIDVAREIRRIDKQVPIVMVTTEAEKVRVLAAIQAGVSDYLVKPFTTEVLKKKLERLARASLAISPEDLPRTNVEHINPFLLSTVSVFEQMLGMDLAREAPFIRKGFSPQYEVTGIIGLTGKTTGTVAVSLPRDMALSITEKLLGERPPEVNAQVIDAIGEVTNMIAGAAKSRLEHLQLSLSLPTVVMGCATCIGFPSRATPISIPFRSTLGPLIVEVGILA